MFLPLPSFLPLRPSFLTHPLPAFTSSSLFPQTSIPHSIKPSHLAQGSSLISTYTSGLINSFDTSVLSRAVIAWSSHHSLAFPIYSHLSFRPLLSSSIGHLIIICRHQPIHLRLGRSSPTRPTFLPTTTTTRTPTKPTSGRFSDCNCLQDRTAHLVF